VRSAANEVKNTVLDEKVWQHAKGLVVVGQPLCELLDFANSSFPTTGKLYFMCFNVQETLAALTPDDAPAAFISAAKEAFRVRWDMLHTPMHAVAYALDPEFWDVDVFSMPEKMEGLDIILERLSRNHEDATKASMQLPLRILFGNVFHPFQAFLCCLLRALRCLLGSLRNLRYSGLPLKVCSTLAWLFEDLHIT
jgi:hypothetical protein